MPRVTQPQDECEHDWQVTGYAPPSIVPADEPCSRPLRAYCRACEKVAVWACKRSSDRACQDCAERNRRYYARTIELRLLQEVAEGHGYAYFVTFTAPGSAEHLRWYQGKRPRTRPTCTCHEHGLTMGAWNRQESACWNRFRTSLVRDVGAVAYAGAVEVQDGKRRADGKGRGALHRHVVMVTETPLVYDEVQRLAIAAGYGCVLDVETVQSPEKAARYLSKYVTKGHERESVPWVVEVVDQETGEVLQVQRDATYRTRSQSQSWGFTVSGLREVARVQARARARALEDLARLLGEGESQAAPVSSASGDPGPP